MSGNLPLDYGREGKYLEFKKEIRRQLQIEILLLLNKEPSAKVVPRTLEFSQILDSHGNVMNVREWSNKCTTVQLMLSHISHSVTYKTPFHTPAGPTYTPHYWGNASNEPTCQRKYWGPSLGVSSEEQMLASCIPCITVYSWPDVRFEPIFMG